MAAATSYIGWSGKTAWVETDLDMGRGSTRNLPQYGVRRAIWDAAFGYVSGFKKTAILYYILTRSLNRSLSIWCMKREGIRFTPDGFAIASSITEKYARG